MKINIIKIYNIRYYIKEGMRMGNLIKINMYAEQKKTNGRIIDIKKLEENILDYNSWLQKNSREDKIENYEKFLQVH